MSSTAPKEDPAFQSHLTTLAKYTACDIADALLAISPSLPRCGFLTDISPSNNPSSIPQRIVAPASTIKMVSKSPSSTDPPNPDPLPSDHENAIPSSAHWTDLAPSDHIVVIESSKDSYAASLGGILALRLSIRGASGVVISGRVRDQDELSQLSMPVWAGGRSAVATGAEQKVWGRECEVEIHGVKVRSGDVICLDRGEGCVVVVPKGLVGEVVEKVGGMVERDERVIEAVRGGMTVKEAFAKFRGKDGRA